MFRKTGLFCVILFVGIFAACSDKFSTPLSPSPGGTSSGGEKPSLSDFSSSAVSAQDCGNPNDQIPDDTSLQACLDRGGYIGLERGDPGYIVSGLNGDLTRGLYLSKNGTVLTTATPGLSAKIIAGRDLFAFILQTPPGQSVNDFTIQEVTFDGMVDVVAQDGTPYRRRRDEGADGRAPGNVFLQGSGFRFLQSESVNAMYGTGLGLFGENYRVERSYIAHNGRDIFSLMRGDAQGAPWSDGMTVLYCRNSYIGHNKLVDNTDIDLALGGGSGCIVELNEIAHFGKFAFTGLNIGNFSSPSGGDHRGSEYRGNRVYSAQPTRLAIGIGIGGHMWNTNVNVHNAGRVVGNTSYGASIPGVIDGSYGGEFTGNNLYDPDRTGFGDCPRFGYNYTVNPDHVKNMTLQDGWTNLAYDSGECIPPLGVSSWKLLKKF